VRDHQSEDIITRILEMKQYVDRTQIGNATGFQMTTKELLALAKFTNEDLCGAVLLAFNYGRAKGYRLAKSQSPILQNEQKAVPSMETEILEAAKLLDPAQLCAVLATAKELAEGTAPVAALAAGNIILASAGYPPAPVYAPESGHTGDGVGA
jgi:hypothetical protein